MAYPKEKTKRGSAAIIIITPQKKFILQHRDDIASIEYPGYWSLFAGWIEVDESPMDTIKRELAEELTKLDGSSPEFGEIKYFSSAMRQDRPWAEHVFCVTVRTPIASLKINEGQGLGEFTFNQCIQLEKIAPHHMKHLIQYRNKILDIVNN